MEWDWRGSWVQSRRTRERKERIKQRRERPGLGPEGVGVGVLKAHELMGSWTVCTYVGIESNNRLLWWCAFYMIRVSYFSKGQRAIYQSSSGFEKCLPFCRWIPLPLFCCWSPQTFSSFRVQQFFIPNLWRSLRSIAPSGCISSGGCFFRNPAPHWWTSHSILGLSTCFNHPKLVVQDFATIHSIMTVLWSPEEWWWM